MNNKMNNDIQIRMLERLYHDFEIEYDSVVDSDVEIAESIVFDHLLPIDKLIEELTHEKK